MKKLKLFFACLLMAVLSIGQVWAVDYDLVYTLDGITGTGGSSAYDAAGNDVVQAELHWAVVGNVTTSPWRIGGKGINGVNRTITGKSPISGTIVKIDIDHGAAASITVNSVTVEVATDADFTDVVSTLTPTFAASSVMTIEHPSTDDAWEDCYYRITYNLTNTTSSNRFVAFNSAKFYKEKSASDPDLSADPVEVDFGTVDVGATVASQTVAVSFANLTGSVTYSGLSDPFSASGAISATGDEITISADATNAGTFEQTLLIESAADSKSVEVTVKMKVAAPTGTFELFSGDIEEGDYVLVSTNALSNSVNSSRLASVPVTISEDKIVNPDASIIWHIAPVSETSYWTLYNDASAKYAGGTTSKNQGALLADVTDYAKWTITEGTGAYNFENLGRATGSSDTGNKWLRYNSGNAENSRWACYGSGTGSAPTLYKKADGKQNADLSYATAQYLIKKNTSFTAQGLTNPHSIEGITYASDNTAVAEVNASTGAVTIKADATGAAKITASFGGDASYRSGSASYTIFVAEQAGTNEDPLSEASAKALIDLGCGLDAHVNGLVLSQNSTNFTVTLTNGFQFYKAKDLGNIAFESAYLGVGDNVTAVGKLTKYSSTYELAEGCYLTFYEQATATLTPIANDKDHPYTVAQALAFAAAPTTYDLSDHVFIQGEVYKVNSFDANNGTYNIYIKDAGTSENDGKFEFYKCAGLYQVGESAVPFAEGDVQVGNIVIGYGVMSWYSGGSIWEFGQPNQLVDLQAPVTGVELAATAEVEEGSTVNLTATILPSNATGTIDWSVTSGAEYAGVDAGVVNGIAEGEAVIRATVHGTEIYAECTVTVKPEAAPDTRKVANSPATFTTISGNLDPADIAFASYQGGAGTAPQNYNDGIRLYQAPNADAIGGYITLTAVAGCTIDEVQITTTNTYATTVAYSVDGNETLLNSESVAKSGSYTTGTGLNVQSVNIVNKGTSSSGRLEIASIKVYYTGEPATIDHYELGGTYQTAFVQNEDFNHTGLIVYAAFDALGENKVDITSMCTFSDPDMSTTGEKTIEITYNEAVVASYTINVAADSRKVADSPATFTTVSGDMTPNDITFVSYQGGAGTAPANYNDGIRLYQAPSADAIGGFITLKAKKGCTIDQVKITTTNSYATTVAYSVDGNENLLGSESVAKSSDYSTPSGLNVESVNIVNKGTGSNGRLEIASIKVWYTGDALPVDHYILGGTYATEFEQFGTFSYEGLTVTAAYDELETITEAVTGFTVEADLSTAGPAKANVMLNNVKIAEYDITVTASAKEDPALVYSPASVVLTLGDALSAPTFSNTHNVSPITYSSDKPAVATVDAEGNIALAGGTGTAIITASFAGDDDYIASEATFTITVNEPTEDLSGTWTLASSVAAGDKIIFMGAKDPKVYAMGKQNSSNRAAVESTLDGDVLTPGAATKVFTLVDAGEGLFAIQASNGKYLTSATSGTSNNLLEAENYELDNAKWTISIDGESSVASIVAAAGSKTVMQYNGGSTLFSCYGSANQSPVKIFKKDATPTPAYVDVRTGLEPNHYYTICYPNAMSSIKGATLWSFIGKDAQYAYLVQETASTIEAGKPYIMYATASTVQAVLGDETNAPGANGAIHGTFNNLVQEQLDGLAIVAGSDLYLVIGDELRRATGEGTGSNTLPAQRAFVVVGDIPAAPANMPAHVRRMPMQTDQTQGFENIEASDKPMKLMIDGQMYILRGEKVYDATGRLVK